MGASSNTNSAVAAVSAWGQGRDPCQSEVFSRCVNIHLFSKFRFLCGDACGAIVGLAQAGGDTADGLRRERHRRIGNGDAVRDEGEGFDKVSTGGNGEAVSAACAPSQ